MLNADNVFLVGPMGSGKSAVGRRLAGRLGLSFVDSDAEIEALTGVDIPYIFEREGEAGFRARERDVLDALTARIRAARSRGFGGSSMPSATFSATLNASNRLKCWNTIATPAARAARGSAGV